MVQTILERTSQGITHVNICEKCLIPYEIGINRCIKGNHKLKLTILITKDQVKPEFRE